MPPLIVNDRVLVRAGHPLGRGSGVPMSWPEENIFPLPPKITTRTVSSASARRNASSSSTSMPRFCALRASIRSNMIRAIMPSSNVSYVM